MQCSECGATHIRKNGKRNGKQNHTCVAGHLQEGAREIFDCSNENKAMKENQQAQVNELYRQIGQLKVEQDFLAGRSAWLGLKLEKLWL
jgi:hypothetical protein